MSGTLSKTISMIRFPMIVGIVFIHSQNKGLFSSVWGGKFLIFQFICSSRISYRKVCAGYASHYFS